MNISPINEESLLIRLGHDISEETHRKVKFYFDQLSKMRGVLSLVPSYNSLMLYYDFYEMDYYTLKSDIEQIHYDKAKMKLEKRIVKLPVCYELGLDLDRVSKHTKLSIEEVIKRHSNRDYLVYMIGFTPGFPYLGGMEPSLETPRLEVPRTKIEAGSVGIGGLQTGVYPLDTPGGWNIIGKTPIDLFDKKLSVTLLNMGEYVRFIPIDRKTYEKIQTEVKKGLYKVEVMTC
ncbi:MAG: 5-oxoprolinase subunit PxpB [Clostridiales bacterium]|nr:5-oxoprolinase subunit PxpB [Clostridiales bacterium]